MDDSFKYGFTRLNKVTETRMAQSKVVLVESIGGSHLIEKPLIIVGGAMLDHSLHRNYIAEYRLACCILVVVGDVPYIISMLATSS